MGEEWGILGYLRGMREDVGLMVVCRFGSVHSFGWVADMGGLRSKIPRWKGSRRCIKRQSKGMGVRPLGWRLWNGANVYALGRRRGLELVVVSGLQR